MLEMRLSARLTPLFIILISLAAGCSTELGAGPRAWIDLPRDGASFAVGQTVGIKAHAYAREGVAEVLFVINGTPLSRNPPTEPGAPFTEAAQTWIPEEPGDYTIQAITFDSAGSSGSPAAVSVQVLFEAAMAVTETPGAPPTDTPTVSALPAIEIRFGADSLTLTQGGCTTLFWEVQYATSVLLDNQEVAESGSKQICPDSTMTYHLHASSPSDDADAYIEVDVLEPADTTPPTIANVSASENVIYKPFCEPNKVTIQAKVTDDVSVSSVQLVYRVVEGSRQGQWRTLTMTGAGNNYRIVLDWEDMERSLDPAVLSSATIEYYIVTRDSAGNENQSGSAKVTLKNCLM